MLQKKKYINDNLPTDCVEFPTPVELLLLAVDGLSAITGTTACSSSSLSPVQCHRIDILNCSVYQNISVVEQVSGQLFVSNCLWTINRGTCFHRDLFAVSYSRNSCVHGQLMTYWPRLNEMNEWMKVQWFKVHSKAKSGLSLTHLYQYNRWA